MKEKISTGRIAFDKRTFKKVNHIDVTGKNLGTLLSKLDDDIIFKVDTTNIMVYLNGKIVLTFAHHINDVSPGDYEFKILFDDNDLHKFLHL